MAARVPDAALTEKPCDSTAPGIPEICPPDESVNPVGSLPDDTDQVVFSPPLDVAS